MKLYSTTDIAASVRAAHKAFTHVVLNRAHTLHKSIPFATGVLLDLPVFMYKANTDSERQLDDWQNKGGVLFTLDTHAGPGQDVTVMIECPYNLARLEAVNKDNSEYGVIPRPVSWTAYDEEIDMRFPETKFLQELWQHCGGREMSDSELSQASGWSVIQVRAMKNALKPKEHWYIQKRLAPERLEFLPAWEWLESGCIPRAAITNAGFRPQVEEMARFGYIGLKRLHHYPSETPNWRKLQKDRNEALKNLSDVRLLVESLPDHLEALSPSDESL